jgi:hypothetical protein
VRFAQSLLVRRSSRTLERMGPLGAGWSESDVEAVLSRGDPQELLYVPIAVGMNGDQFAPGWAEAICLRLVSHPHFNVRGNALLGLGHVARTCRWLNFEQVLPLLSAGLQDPNGFVRGHAQGAACELEMWLGIHVPGYDGEQTQAVLDAIEKVKRDDAL